MTFSIPRPALQQKDYNPGIFAPVQSGKFSPDGTQLLLNTSIGPQSRVMVLDVKSGRLLWEKANFYSCRFLGKGALVMGHECRFNGVVVLDSQTGAEHARFASEMPIAVSAATADDRLIIMRGYDASKRPVSTVHFWNRWLEKHRPPWLGDARSCLNVVEPATGRELFRLRGLCGNAVLSDNGRILVTWTGLQIPPPGDRVELGLQVWSVHPHRAYFWAITWSLGVGILLLLWRRWRVKRKAAGVQVQSTG